MIKDFNFYAPTRVVFGKSSEEKIAELVMAYQQLLKDMMLNLMKNPTIVVIMMHWQRHLFFIKC